MVAKASQRVLLNCQFSRMETSVIHRQNSGGAKQSSTVQSLKQKTYTCFTLCSTAQHNDFYNFCKPHTDQRHACSKPFWIGERFIFGALRSLASCDPMLVQRRLVLFRGHRCGPRSVTLEVARHVENRHRQRESTESADEGNVCKCVCCKCCSLSAVE